MPQTSNAKTTEPTPRNFGVPDTAGHPGRVRENTLRLPVAKQSASAVADGAPAASANGDVMDASQQSGLEFPRRDAAVRKGQTSGWELADAILADCPKPSGNGVRNGSHDKINAMLEEIAKNHGDVLSLVRARNLRRTAANFPPDRRRAGVSLEVHLAVKTPDELDRLIANAPEGAVITRKYVQGQKSLEPKNNKPEQGTSKGENLRQVKQQCDGLQALCEQLEEERDQREQRYIDLCGEVGRKPEPFEDGEPWRTPADSLNHSVRRLLMLRGIDPTSVAVKPAIDAFVQAVTAQQQ